MMSKDNIIKRLPAMVILILTLGISVPLDARAETITAGPSEDINVNILGKLSTPRTIRDIFQLESTYSSSFSQLTDIEDGSKLIPSKLRRFGANTHEKNKQGQRPQGVTVYTPLNGGRYIINSWYYTKHSEYKDLAKLTITDQETKKYVRVFPVQWKAGSKSWHAFETHAGGIDIVGDFLYMPAGTRTKNDGTTYRILRVFDLKKIYARNENDTVFQNGGKRVNGVNFITPEVGRIHVKTPGNASISFVSSSIIDGQRYLLTGNFYSGVDGNKFKKGGKSMIWMLPMKNRGLRFPIIDLNKTIVQIEPKHQGGNSKGETMSRLQGVAVLNGGDNGDYIIFSRSYSKDTSQLVVQKYDDILSASRELTGYFHGSSAGSKSYNSKNWYQGLEDLHIDDQNNLWTVTEFVIRDQTRKLISVDMNDIKALVD